MKNLLTLIFLMTLFGMSLSGQEIMLLKTSGKVVIGDTTQIQTPGNYNLYVQNGILTERVKVALKHASEWSDDAFDHTPSLTDVETSINKNKHLLEMPSVNTLLQEGYELKEMDALLLKQIEWLWQYVIELSKDNKEQAHEIQQLKAQLIKSTPSQP